jgi:NADPH:quinone reductase-like Zn-dependent oxidoreductase
MKAIVYHHYGSPDDVLELQDIDRPLGKDREVLVCIIASS